MICCLDVLPKSVSACFSPLLSSSSLGRLLEELRVLFGHVESSGQ